MNCPYCNNPVPANANNCPGCGAAVTQQQAPQAAPAPQVVVQQSPAAAQGSAVQKKSKWMAIVSMILGILSLLNELAYDEFDDEHALGVLLFIILALVFGIISLCKKRGGKGMAIAGIVTAGIAILIDLGIF